MRSSQAIEVIGCTYRQLDYLTRCTNVKPAGSAANPGSGGRRLWSHGQVVRLTLAYHLAQVVPDGTFPEIAAAAMDPELPEPPRRGYAMYVTQPMEVRWVATWPDVRPVLDVWGAAAIAAYDLDALVGQHFDVDQLVA